MGSVKFKDLKAYVRYDGSGRVVAGSLVFRKKKPKNGRWGEISSNLCCNASGSTTTTTTQGGGGGNTPTAWVAYVASNPYSACQENGGTSTVLYTSTSVLGTGVTLYQDAALTILYDSVLYGTSVKINGVLYGLVDNAPPVIAVVHSCDGFTTTSSTTSNPSYSVGQYALGGVVAYILQPGDPGYDPNVQHGLVATINDVTSGVATGWGCYGQFITNASNTAIGAGATNTDSIASQCAQTGIAAKVCLDLIEGGYSDWVLPSSGELIALWNNRGTIGGFGNPYYFSSTQGDSSSGETTSAYGINSSNGVIYGYDKTADIVAIRAVRYF